MNRTKLIFIQSILTLVMVLSKQNSSAQIRQMTLKIDTLIENDYQYFFIQTQRQHLQPYLLKDSFCIIDYIGKSLTCKLNIQSDTSTIKISLDKRGGYLELRNIFTIKSDTIAIEKLTVYDKPYCDTNWTTTHYYYLKADTLAENFKTTRESNIDKVKRKNLTPIQTFYVINNSKYFCTTSWEKSDNEFIITKFHGRGRTSIFKGKKPFYFHRTKKSTLTFNIITIQLKNGT